MIKPHLRLKFHLPLVYQRLLKIIPGKSKPALNTLELKCRLAEQSQEMMETRRSLSELYQNPLCAFKNVTGLPESIYAALQTSLKCNTQVSLLHIRPLNQSGRFTLARQVSQGKGLILDLVAIFLDLLRSCGESGIARRRSSGAHKTRRAEMRFRQIETKFQSNLRTMKRQLQ